MEAFGLQLSDKNLKIIELKKESDDLILANFNALNLDEGTISNGAILKPKELASSIKTALNTARMGKIKKKHVVACLPESESFVRIINLPKVPEEELNQAVRSESEQHIPLSTDEVYLDWQQISDDGESIKILVAASPKKLVNQYIDVVKKASLVPIILEVESAATARSLIHEGKKESYLIVDIKISNTNLIINDKGTLQFTSSIPLSGGHFTEKLAKGLKINLNEAEKIKRTYGLTRPDKPLSVKVNKILLPLVSELSDEIIKVIKFYQNHFPLGQEISKIILSGGGARLKGLTPELKMLLKKEVVLGNPWVNILTPKQKYLPELNLSESISYATAIGLGIRGIKGY